MATIVPLIAPRSFIIGATFEWREQNNDYFPPIWTATAAFVAPSDQQSVVGSDNGDGTHLIRINDVASAKFKAGIYRYQVTATDGATTRFLVSGALEAVAAYKDVSGGRDDRSGAAIIYDAITAVMQCKASNDQSSLAVGGRSLSRYTWDELWSARGEAAFGMTNAERMARGFMPELNSQVRFIR